MDRESERLAKSRSDGLESTGLRKLMLRLIAFNEILFSLGSSSSSSIHDPKGEL